MNSISFACLCNAITISPQTKVAKPRKFDINCSELLEVRFFLILMESRLKALIKLREEKGEEHLPLCKHLRTDQDERIRMLFQMLFRRISWFICSKWWNYKYPVLLAKESASSL